MTNIFFKTLNSFCNVFNVCSIGPDYSAYLESQKSLLADAYSLTNLNNPEYAFAYIKLLFHATLPLFCSHLIYGIQVAVLKVVRCSKSNLFGLKIFS